MAEGLMNNYDVHEYPKEEFNVDHANVVVDVLPSERKENGVTKIGAPFTLRLVCNSELNEACPIKLDALSVSIYQDVIFFDDQFEWRNNEWGGRFYSSILIDDFNIPRSEHELCVLLNIDGIKEKELCMRPTIKSNKRFFLLDWWEGI